MLRAVKRALLMMILAAGALGVLFYVGDYAVLKVRVAAKRNPYGSVTVQHYYAVQQKNGKTEFLFDPPQPQTCVNALFPHGGYAPCWYLNRHREPATNI